MIPVKVSDKALEEIKKTIAHKNIPDEYGLRIGVNGGGCAGVSYVLGFDKKGTGDAEFTLDNVPVYIAKKDTMFLIGMEVDFYEGNDARGFTFIKSDEKQQSVQ
ncbi:iron-sulfur cluster assembly protein [Catalinimonas alkaloidigena]|uniref:HesB/IscA family protein n=1 Tax=Catalinimonas alkaloidigena TaxID=1075417 RepID=UPI0024064309|nr:iron-sulfur cluster assembly accessory protein [Catalinimonas alkaloidigena]MDF9800662.1 iron-sulfur cluster assembly protein [Catalinimonas alkaloidigena]